MFIVPSHSFKRKTPDMYIDGVPWEIKGPTGNTHQTISRQIKKATKQSKNIIIDTSRTKLPDTIIEKWLRKNLQQHKSLQNLKLITKNGKIVAIK